MKNGLGLLIAATVIFTAAFACDMSTVNMSSFKTAKDADGKTEATSFKAGETVYANAVISNAPGKVTVKMYMTVEDAPGLKKGDTLPGTEVKIDLPSSGTAKYNVPLPASFKGGKFNVVAEMLNETGEKKDSKSVAITVEAGAAAPPADTDDN